MNCLNCGAPTQETSGRGRMVCQFCGSLQLLAATDDSIDQVILLEQFGDHDCPGCDQRLTKAILEDSEIEMCHVCHGLLLHREVFHDVVWHRRSLYAGGEEPQQPVSQEELKQIRSCPACSGSMETHAYYGPGNAVIDSCARCDLVWLDVGELTTIERAPGRRTL